jgi:hypothetical protein
MITSLDHSAVKTHLDETTRDLGISVHTVEHEDVNPNIRVVHGRIMDVYLPHPVQVRASFSHERFIDQVKRLFKHHAFEVGVSAFDARVHVATSTPEPTRRLLSHARVQEALLLLITKTRRVEIADDIVRAIDQDANEAQEDVAAELVALTAYLTDNVPKA